MRRLTVALFALGASLAMIAGTATAKVLRVGTYHGVKGQYQSLQAAVDAAKPGDWILVGPGDYKTSTIRTPKGAPNFPAGVLITTRNIHIRGMNRNTVIVDGTKPGSAVCSRKGSAQNLGLRGRAANNPYGGTAKAARSGANGLMVFKAASLYDSGQPCGPAANAAKYLGAEAGFKACETAVMTHGGYGYAKEFHVERYFRESLIPRLAPVSPQLILCFIAEKVLGLPKSY